MNQGVYFGQIVIGPAGSGKVFLFFIFNSLLIVNICNKWLKHCVVTLLFSILTQQPNIMNIRVMLISNSLFHWKM